MTIDVERLNVADGKTVELDKVLLVAAGDKVTIGKPTVGGAKNRTLPIAELFR